MVGEDMHEPPDGLGMSSKFGDGSLRMTRVACLISPILCHREFRVTSWGQGSGEAVKGRV